MDVTSSATSQTVNVGECYTFSMDGPKLIDIVRDWLQVNRPFMYIDSAGTIGARTDGGRYWFADIDDTRVVFFDYKDEIPVYAADPEFFAKLDKYLPPKL